MNTLIEEALELAVAVHKQQIDKTGNPYILHVLRVASKAKNNVELVTAILHDVIEDSRGLLSIQDLEDTFPPDIIEAVNLLTRYPDEKYMEYIEGLSKNTLATRIKLYDLEDNLDSMKHNFVGCESLFKRYERAEEFLLNVVNRNPERYGY